MPNSNLNFLIDTINSTLPIFTPNDSEESISGTTTSPEDETTPYSLKSLTNMKFTGDVRPYY